MPTLKQMIDYCHAHGAPAAFVQQLMLYGHQHRLNGASFQDLCNRLRWHPRGVSWGDATNWARFHR